MSFRHGLSVVEVDVDGGAIPPAPPLNALSFSDADFRVGEAVSAMLLAATAAATRSLVSGTLPAGLALDWGTLELTGVPLASGEFDITIREERAGAPNSPRDTQILFVVAAAAIHLTPLTLGPVNLTDDMLPGDVVAAVEDATEGAEIAMEGPAFDDGHLALNFAGTAIIVGADGPLLAGSGTGEFTLIQTLEEAENSPHASGPFATIPVLAAPSAAPVCTRNPAFGAGSSLVIGGNLELDFGDWDPDFAPTALHGRLQSSANPLLPGRIFLEWTDAASGIATDIDPGDSLFLVVRASNASGTTYAASAAHGPVAFPAAHLGLISNIAEGNAGITNRSVTVDFSAPAIAGTQLNWAVSGTGANPATGADFDEGGFPAGTVTPLAGATSATFNIPIAGDTVIEPDKGVAVTISAPVNCTIGTPTRTFQILNDDVAVAPVVTDAGAISGARGDGNMLTGTAATATGTPLPSLAYQWQKYEGGAWSNIAAATSANMADTAALSALPIRRQVTASNSAGNAVQVSNTLDSVSNLSWPYAFALSADVVGWGSSTMNGGDTPTGLGPMNALASLTSGETFYGPAAAVPDAGGIICANRGNGGETEVQISARMVAASARLKAANAILSFIGNYNSGPDPVGAHISAAQTAVGPTGLNHSRFLHVPKHNDRGSKGGGLLWARYRDAITRLSALYPGRVQDPAMVLRAMAPIDATDAADKLADTAMLNYSADDSHLNVTGYTFLAEQGYAPWAESKEAGGLPFVPWQRVYSTAATNQTNGGLVANLQWDAAGAAIAGKTFQIIGPNAADFTVVVNGAALELRRASGTLLLDAPLYITLRISNGSRQRDCQLAVYLMDLTGTRRGRARIQGHHMGANTGLMAGLRGVTGTRLSFLIGLKVNAGAGTDRALINFGGTSTGKGLILSLKTSDVITIGARDLVDNSLTINHDSSTTTAQKFLPVNGVVWAFGTMDLDAGTSSLRINENAATTTTSMTGRQYCVANQANEATMHVMFGTTPGVRNHPDTELEALAFWNGAIDWSNAANRARAYDVATRATRLHETVGADGPGVVAGLAPFFWMQGCAANIMGGLNLASGQRVIDGHDPLPMVTA